MLVNAFNLISSSVKGAPLLSWDYREGSWHTEQLSYLPEVSQVQKVRAGSPGNRLTGKILYCLWVYFFQKFQNTHGMPLLWSHLKEELCTWAVSSPCFLLVWCMQHCVLELRGHSCLPLNTVRQICEKENKFSPFITSYFLWFTK